MKEIKKGRAFGIASMCCGISSLGLFLMPYFATPLSITGIVFANIQKGRLKTSFTTAGLITSIIGLVISAGMWFLFLVGLYVVSKIG